MSSSVLDAGSIQHQRKKSCVRVVEMWWSIFIIIIEVSLLPPRRDFLMIPTSMFEFSRYLWFFSKLFIDSCIFPYNFCSFLCFTCQKVLPAYPFYLLSYLLHSWLLSFGYFSFVRLPYFFCTYTHLLVYPASSPILFI